MYTSPEILPRLFFKPSPESLNSEILFSKFSQDLGEYISFRSFDMGKDIDLIYEWVNSPYAIEFWKMNGPKDVLFKTYSSIIVNPHAHSFIGLLGNQQVCQFDVYRVLADELSNHISADPEDCGIHILMAPNNTPIKGLSSIMVSSFLKFFFSFPIAGDMYGEPDTNNHKAKNLIEPLGFKYQHEAELSYKTASVYRLTRQTFTPKFN
jgi:hypothetical protein